VADTNAKQPAEAAQSGKASWPKTPAGTVDWETVFEHPETGLMAQIARAETPQALREQAIVIIKQLFSRKGDEADAAKLTGELTDLIADTMPADRLALVHYAVAATFREIKTFRQKKAAEYELAKANKSGATERRTAGKSPQSIKQALARKKQRRMLIAIISVLVIAGIGAGAWFYLRAPKHPPRTDLVLLQQIRSAAAGGTAPTHVYGGAIQTRRYLGDITVTAENVPIDACITLGVNLANHGTFAVNGDLLAHGGANEARALCRAATAPIRITWTPVQ
jgi:hypothetical protein